MQKLRNLIENGEGDEVEFKKQLSEDTHLEEDKRRDSLAGQMKNRLIMGEGEAIYVIGVTDDGGISGLSPEKFNETVRVISTIAGDVKADIVSVETEEVDNTGKKIGMITISNGESDIIDSDNVVVGTAGHVDHGKSTLVASIVSNRKDDGDGELRGELDTLPHEKERGLSADLSYSVYGFNDGDIVNLNRENDKEDVVEKSDKLISFVDTVGHQPWLGTAIRGLVGQRLDYGLLVVAANEGVTKTTKEHLGILMAVNLPTIVAITKTDLVDEEQIQEVEKEIEKVMMDAGCRSILCNRYGIEQTTEKVIDSISSDNGNLNPIIRTSSVNREGIDQINHIFRRLPKTSTSRDDTFRMYVDKTYQVEGVGKIISGAVKSGKVEEGDEVVIGPDKSGKFREVEVKSIEMHYHKVNSAETGNIIGISLRGIENIDVRRGMVVTNQEAPQPSKEFVAEVIVLNHPTNIRDGYEPMVHMDTISEVAQVKTEDPLLPGEKGEVKFEFKRNSYLVEEGQKFIFREGDAKGIGTVKEVK